VNAPRTNLAPTDPVIDLDAYFARIGYRGPRSATLETLSGIHAGHAQAVPFENLNPLLKWPVRLDPASLEQKLVRDGRGGWCYEHNMLLSYVLRALGFRVTWLAARVLYNAAEGAAPARSHMLLRIDLGDQPYIADVGFGGLTLTAPLRLEPDIEQSTPHEPFRLIRASEEFVQQAKIHGAWKTLYRFALHEQLLADYEVSNWYLSNHPESIFVTGLIAARPDSDRRYTLRNNELLVHHLDGRTERRVLGSPAELRSALEGPLRLRLPDSPALDAILQRFAHPVGSPVAT
jgi:N-hydroxyarylamine O-acetyltransferase